MRRPASGGSSFPKTGYFAHQLRIYYAWLCDVAGTVALWLCGTRTFPGRALLGCIGWKVCVPSALAIWLLDWLADSVSALSSGWILISRCWHWLNLGLEALKWLTVRATCYRKLLLLLASQKPVPAACCLFCFFFLLLCFSVSVSVSVSVAVFFFFRFDFANSRHILTCCRFACNQSLAWPSRLSAKIKK